MPSRMVVSKMASSISLTTRPITLFMNCVSSIAAGSFCSGLLVLWSTMSYTSGQAMMFELFSVCVNYSNAAIST